MNYAPLPVTLRQLQYVVAVAETLNFRRAAELCAVSQPALSAQLAEAEDALGVRLFDRGRRGVLLTAAGEALVARARGVLLATEDLAAAARGFVDPLAGTLRLGVIPTLGPYLLPRVAPGLRTRFPRLTIAWIEDKTEVLVRRLMAGEVDGALLALVGGLEPLEWAELARDPFVLAMPPEHALASEAGPVSAKRLDRERVLLLDEGHCFRDQALDVCAKAGAEELGFRATSLSTLAQMVAGGTGLTLLPEIAVETEAHRAGLVTRPLAPPAPARTLILAWRPGSAVEPAMRALAEAMTAQLARRS